MLRRIINFALLIANCLVKKNKRSLLFIPHKNCKTDHYDIFNYTADNTLCLFVSIIKDIRFDKFDLWLVYYHPEQYSEYRCFFDKYNRLGKIVLVNASCKKEMVKALMHFSICFFSETYMSFKFKAKTQMIIGLNYFTPFKNDQIVLRGLDFTKLKSRWTNINKTVDYEMCTSVLSSRIMSTDNLLLHNRFLPLGFPRNDIFYHDDTTLRYAFLKAISMSSVKKIFCYTPTYRDYERPDLSLADDLLVENKSIFGNVNDERDKELNELLKENDAIVIVKLHPWQEKSIIKNQEYSQIVLFNEIESQMKISLYDVLSISDCLITDYTSTVFDYLHSDKPVIYYFYDYDKYLQNRGFSYEPIDYVCAGPIAYSYIDLLKHVREVLSGCDEYKSKREFVHRIFNKYHDGKSSARIKDFVLEKIDNNSKME